MTSETTKAGDLGLFVGILTTSIAFVFAIIPMYVIPDTEERTLETCEIEEQVTYYGD